ncbi:MAG: leucine-rich repeat domain-containing protein [Thermoleophilia bacterium]
MGQVRTGTTRGGRRIRPALRVIAVALVVAALFGIAGAGVAVASTTQVDCSTSGTFTITDNVVTSQTDCTGTMSIPGTVTAIANYALQGANATSISIPESVTSIGTSALLASSEQINVDTSNVNYSSDAGVLFNKSKTRLIQFPSRSPLTEYSIPSTVTVVGEAAFATAQTLLTIHIPASVLTIERYGMQNMFGLRTVDFAPSSALQTIGELAFESSGMTSFTIPSSVTTIGGSAFANTPNLTSLAIPSSVASIDGGAFANVPQLTSITVAAGNTHFSADGGVLFNQNRTAILAYPTGLTATSYAVPQGVTTVTDNAFAIGGNTTLQRITIPGSVTDFGFDVFSGAAALAVLRFEGNAPTVKTTTFIGIAIGDPLSPRSPASVIERIPRTSGWGSGATWNDVALAYYLPVPAVPTAVAGAVSATVTVALPATGPSPDTYTIRTVENGTKTCTITPPETHCAISGLTSGASYTFTATAHTSSPTVDSPESAASTAITPTAAPDPPAPSPTPSPTPDPPAPSPTPSPTPNPPASSPAPSPAPDPTLNTSRATLPLKASTQDVSPTAAVVETTFVAPGPGTVTQVGTLATTRHRTRASAAPICATRQRVSRAGKVTVVCSLSRAAKRARAKHALRVSLVTTFTPPSGAVLVSTQIVTFARTPAGSPKLAVMHDRTVR